jgi:hypothetical protein
MLSLILDPLVLMFIMYLVARHEADLEFPKIFLICFLVSVVVFVVSLAIGPLAIIVYALLLPWALFHFCCLRWKMAFLVFGIFFAYQILFKIVFGLLLR